MSEPTRMGIILNTYHQIDQNDPTGDEFTLSQLLKSEEEVYRRRLSLGEKWVPLDTGWVENVNYILITNPTTPGSTIPSPEEVASRQEEVVEVGLLVGVENDVMVIAQVEPDGVFLFCPVDTEVIRLRCRKGKTKVSLSVYPR